MSPRKSSTSSGNLSPRPRYLGVEVAGDLPVPARWVERELGRLLQPTAPGPAARLRVIRWDGNRGLIEVGHRDVPRARQQWNGEVDGPSGTRLTIATRRSWGTLRGGKRWIRDSVH